MKPTIAVVPRRRLGRPNLTSSLRSERSITLSSDQLEEGLLEAGLARTQLHKGHPRLSGQAIEPGCERNRTLDAQASVLLPERKTVVLDDSCENGQLRPLLGHGHELGSAHADVLRRSTEERPAILENYKPVGDLFDLGEEVTADDQLLALIAESAHQLADPRDPLRVQPIRRLVQEEQVGVGQQRTSDAKPLLHAHRVRALPVVPALAEAHQI